MSQRATEDWVQSYLECTDIQETPEEIHFWVSMTILGAALRRQVFVNRGTYTLYPNLYVIIVAESARVRKSVAMNLGLKLLRDAVPDIYILADRMTPEGLVKYMNRTVATTMEGDATKAIIKTESHVLIHADELANLFGYDKQQASRMTILLTRTYEAPSRYVHTTKGDGQIEVKNCYTSLLAATDPHNLKVLPEEAVGGLLGRSIFVPVRDRKKKIAWPDNVNEELWQKLTVDLARISAMKGEMVLTKEAREFFTEWYDKFADLEFNDPRLDAFHQRAHDTALKVATLISASRSSNLVMELEHVSAGCAIIEQQMPAFNRIINWTGASVYAQSRAKVLDLLSRNKGILMRRQIMRTLAFSADEIDLLQKSMAEDGSVEVVQGKSDTMWKLSPEEVARMQRKGGEE